MKPSQNDADIREVKRSQNETAASIALARFLTQLRITGVLLRHAIILLAVLFFSILFLDVPFRLYDGILGYSRSLIPSNWLSVGDSWLSLSVFFLLLVTRGRDAPFAGKVISTAWIACGLAILALLIYMAPQLTQADMPSLRFASVTFFSWFCGQFIGVYVYDYTRGGKWWRAPLYGGAFAFGIQTLIYIPGQYFGTSVPWISWLIIDFGIKLLWCLAFLPVYFCLRRTIRRNPGSLTPIQPNSSRLSAASG